MDRTVPAQMCGECSGLIEVVKDGSILAFMCLCEVLVIPKKWRND